MAEVAAPEAGLGAGERISLRDAPVVRARLEVDVPEPAALECAPNVGRIAEPCFPRDCGVDAQPGVVALEMGDDQVGHHDVERAGRERQAGYSGGGKGSGSALAGSVEHRQRRIDPDDEAPFGVLGPLGPLGRSGGDHTRPGADVEHRLAGFERNELQEIACEGLEARMPRAFVLAGDRVV